MNQQSSLGRRELLLTGGALATTALLARTSYAADYGYVDAHSHLWSTDRTHYPLAPGAKEEDVKPTGFDIGTFFSVAGPEGVSRVVGIGHGPHFGTDASYLTDLLKARPGQVAVQAQLDFEAPDATDRMRALRAQGVTAFRVVLLAPWTDYLPEQHPLMRVYDAAAISRVAICALTSPEWLPQLDRLSEMFPATTVVIDHFARIGMDGFGQTPPVPGTIKPGDIANLARLARHPLTYVKLSAYYALGRRTPPYEDMLPTIHEMIRAYGPERLMWGSDSPYQLAEGQGYRASISLIRDRLDVTVADREWLLRKTAERVYFS
jgi:predicted TIM-barrel fold metal-dependent hydrolase